jgi:hypothetical protein
MSLVANPCTGGGTSRTFVSYASLQAFGIGTKEALLAELQHQLGATPAPAGVA